MPISILRPAPWLAACLFWATCAPGCARPPEKGVLDDNPSVRIRAIKRAESTRDLSVVKDLVNLLGDEDPATRFYAIQGLVRITGEDKGYRYYEPLAERQKAVERWKEHLAEMESVRPADAAGSPVEDSGQDKGASI